MKGMIDMAARRTRKNAELDVNLDDLDAGTDTIIEDPILEDADDDVAEEVAAPKRKYFSHANCSHARKGEAGKAARAACRRAIRQWLNAEAEFLNGDDSVQEAV